VIRRCVFGMAMVAGPCSIHAQSVLTDIAYVAPDGEQQRLDLYLPDAHNYPTLILVHGGGLTQDDKRLDSLPAICANLSRAGIGCASINYRLGPAANWPAQPEDVAAAVAWIRGNISAHGGDSSRLMLLGHSSGCLLASVVGTDPRYLAKHKLGLTAVRGVVAMGCLLSPVPPAISDSGRLRAFFTSGRFPTFPSLEAFLDADPSRHAGATTPPFLVLIADAEQINPPILEKARIFEARMRAAGRSIQVAVLPDRRHYTALTAMASSTDPTFHLVLEFVRRVNDGQ
jgi:acetyl esterase/lipase